MVEKPNNTTEEKNEEERLKELQASIDRAQASNEELIRKLAALESPTNATPAPETKTEPQRWERVTDEEPEETENDRRLAEFKKTLAENRKRDEEENLPEMAPAPRATTNEEEERQPRRPGGRLKAETTPPPSDTPTPRNRSVLKKRLEQMTSGYSPDRSSTSTPLPEMAVPSRAPSRENRGQDDAVRFPYENLSAKEELEKLERELVNTRAIYASSYEEFLTARREKRGKLKAIWETVFGGTVKIDELSNELKEKETEYNAAIIAYGKAMNRTKTEELSNINYSPDEVKTILERYRQNEIFQKIIIDEQLALARAKAESLPPKERGMIGKCMDAWINMDPKKRRVLSWGLSIGLSAGFTIATGGAVGFAWAGSKALRMVAGTAASQGMVKLVDKISGKATENIKNREVEKIRSEFNPNQLGIGTAKFEYDRTLAKEKFNKRLDLSMKAVAGLAAGLGTSTALGVMTGEIVPGGGRRSPGVISIEKPTPESVENPKIGPASETTSPSNPAVKVTPAQEIPKGTRTPTETAPNIPENTTTPEKVDISENVIVRKGEGIENVFIRQIESNPNMAEWLGYKGDVNDTKALHIFAQHKAHSIAIEKGYVDTETGREVRITEADKVGYQLSVRLDGSSIVTEVDEKGNVLAELDQKGDYEFGENEDNKYDTIYKKGAATAQVEMPAVENTEKAAPDEIKVPADDKPSEQPAVELNKTTEMELEPEEKEAALPEKVEDSVIGTTEPELIRTQEKILYDSLTAHPHRGLGTIPEESNSQETPNEVRRKVLEEERLARETEVRNKLFGQYGEKYRVGLPHDSTSPKTEAMEEILKSLRGTPFAKNTFNLSPEILVKVSDLYQENIRQISSGEKYNNIWLNMKDLPVRDKFGEYVEGDRLIPYLNKLKEVTGLEAEARLLPLQDPETIREYIARALQYAATKEGMLDKLNKK